MKILVSLCILLLGYFVYRELSDKHISPLDQEELGQVLKSNSSEAMQLKASFQQVLPYVGSQNSIRSFETGPHVVVIGSSPNELDSESVVEKLKGFADSKEQQGLDYARWALFTADYTPDEKEHIFNEATQILSQQEITLLAQDVLLKGAHRSLLERATKVGLAHLNENQAKDVMRSILQSSQDENVRDVLIEYASGRNLNIE